MKNSYILLDSSGFLYAGHHAYEQRGEHLACHFERKTESGEVTREPFITSSLYYTIKASLGLKKKIAKEFPDYSHKIAIAFDSQKDKSQCARYNLIDGYKENRPPMPTVLRDQKIALYQNVEHLGFGKLCQTNCEADDLMGIYAEMITKNDPEARVFIASQDKDLEQCITDRVMVVKSRGGDVTFCDEKWFREKRGFPPNLMAAYLALCGDSVDCIHGVAGIGEKGAQALLSHFENDASLCGAISERTLPQIDGISDKDLKKLQRTLNTIADNEDDYKRYRTATGIIYPETPVKEPKYEVNEEKSEIFFETYAMKKLADEWRKSLKDSEPMAEGKPAPAAQIVDAQLNLF